MEKRICVWCAVIRGCLFSIEGLLPCLTDRQYLLLVSCSSNINLT